MAKAQACFISIFLLPFLAFAQGEHLVLGNPSNAKAELADSLNFLLEKNEYALSYNCSKGTANWVSWHLDSTWLGEAERQDNFRADTTLPKAWFRVRPSHYSNTGLDKGHLCPSADRTSSVEANKATFLMSNMIPQAPQNNRQTWANLEEYCRRLVADGEELYIVAGPSGKGGEGAKGFRSNIANEHIQVPEFVWKVILTLPIGKDDLHRINKDTRIIAVNMPNNQSMHSDWSLYRVSVNELEQLTGFDFLSAIPSALQQELESKVDKLPIK